MRGHRALTLTLAVALFIADKYPLWTLTLTIRKDTHNGLK